MFKLNQLVVGIFLFLSSLFSCQQKGDFQSMNVEEFDSLIQNEDIHGNLFVYASGTTMIDGKEVEMTKELLEQGAQFVHPAMTFMGFEGKPAGYFVIFCVCAVAYLLGWVIMKALVPKYKPIVLD